MTSISRTFPVPPTRFDLTDRVYHRPEDSEFEVASMNPGTAELDIIPSIWGRKY